MLTPTHPHQANTDCVAPSNCQIALAVVCDPTQGICDARVRGLPKRYTILRVVADKAQTRNHNSYVSKAIADMLKKVLPLMSLRAFVVAGRYESFKIAAETLNISPGAISRNLPPSATAADALKRAVERPPRYKR